MDMTTATTGGGSALTIEDMLETLRKVDALPKLDKWIVINPQGQVFTGTLEQVLPVLMREHPMVKVPLTIPFREP